MHRDWAEGGQEQEAVGTIDAEVAELDSPGGSVEGLVVVAVVGIVAVAVDVVVAEQRKGAVRPLNLEGPCAHCTCCLERVKLPMQLKGLRCSVAPRSGIVVEACSFDSQVATASS